MYHEITWKTFLNHFQDNNLTRQVYHISEDLNVTCLDSKEVEGELCKMTGSSGGLKQAVNQHSDLIPNIYEGEM